MSFQPGYLSYNQLREAAEDFLNQYHDERTIPVPIEEIVEFDLNISVVAIEGLRQQLGVDAFLTNDVGRIFMDQWVMMSAPERYRFSLAHEVAHYWIHSDLYEASTIGSVKEWTDVQAAIGEEGYKWFERQANSLAGLILVPQAELRSAFQNVQQLMRALGVDVKKVDHHPVRQHVIRSLAGQFKVGEQTMGIRLEKDGLLAAL